VGAASSDYLLKVHNLTKIENGKKILDQATFEIAENKIVGFLGPNGAGKTTTFRILSELTGYDDGEIYVNGVKLSDLDRREIMLLPDAPLLFSVLTGKEYLKFMSELLNFDIDSPEIKEMLQLLGLLNSLNKQIFNY
jgi:ABC-2 type transport system ATP-binding protein